MKSKHLKSHLISFYWCNHICSDSHLNYSSQQMRSVCMPHFRAPNILRSSNLPFSLLYTPSRRQGCAPFSFPSEAFPHSGNGQLNQNGNKALLLEYTLKELIISILWRQVPTMASTNRATSRNCSKAPYFLNVAPRQAI